MSERETYYRRVPWGSAVRNVTHSEWKPVAVIDPTDAGQTDGLVEPIARKWKQGIPLSSPLSKAIIDALAEYAQPKPPKPEEPKGIGAVVKTIDGEVWVRFFSKTGAWWRNRDGINCRWDGLDVPDEDHILSWGIEAE